MKKSRGILVLILTAIVTVFFCYTAAVGIGPTGTGAMKNIKTGFLIWLVVSALHIRQRTATQAVKT